MRFTILILTLLFSAQASLAEDIPGQSDFAFTEAVARWLAEDDPIGALRDVGDLAAGGNIAAQVFANRIDRMSWTFPPEYQDVATRRSLFPRAEGDARQRRLSLYLIDRDSIPALAARAAFAEATSAEEAALALETIAGAGMSNDAFSLLVGAYNRFGNEPVLFEAMAPYANGSQRRVGEIWWSMHLEIYRRDTDLSLSPYGFAEWHRTPEDILTESGFFEALEAGQWSAFFSTALLAEMASEDTAPWLLDDRIQFVRAVWTDWVNETATAEDMSDLGRMIGADPAPYHDPLSRVCSDACGLDHPECVAAGSLAILNRSQALAQLEPFVQAAQFYASPRADLGLRLAIGDRIELGRVTGLPRCILDAAILRR